MRFATPSAAWLFLLIAAAVLAGVIARKKDAILLEGLADRALLPHILPRRGGGGVRRMLLAVAVLTCGVLALLRPQGDELRDVSLRSGMDIMVALDTSRSMLSDDVRPTRLDRAKAAIERASTRLNGDRVGLLLFAGSSFLACPLTTDYAAFREALSEADSHVISKGGTSLAAALSEATRGFGTISGRSRLLILVSDGEDHATGIRDAVEALRRSGVMVATVAVGTEEGGLIPGEDGAHAFQQDRHGSTVKSRRNDSVLREIAEATGGEMVVLDDPDVVARLCDARRPYLEQRAAGAAGPVRYVEWFQVPLGMACLLLLFDCVTLLRRRTP